MFVVYPAWLSRAFEAIRAVADRPWTLFALLLALNAIARPASVTAHDARLYSLQAINHAEAGAFADDVFLRFGSQDQFSLFSQLVGPIVATIGLRAAFFVLYLIFNTLFLFALFRLIRTLIDDPVIATLSLVYLVTAPLHYGGYEIFAVQEQFFTPRLVGTTFTLFALEQIVRRRFVAAIAFLAVGAAIHPLMAFGGAMIWVGVLVINVMPMRVFLALCLMAFSGLATILAAPSIGVQLFGEIDDTWHQQIRVAVGYNYPDTWLATDWFRLVVTFGILITGNVVLYRDNPERSRFFAIVTLAGAVGFLTTLFASFLPYALLFQGQPYRVLWILTLFQAPLGFMLIARWGTASSSGCNLGAIGLMAYFCVQHYLPTEFMILAATVAIAVVFSRFSEVPGASWRGAAYGLVVGALGWMLYRCWCFVTQADALLRQFDMTDLALFGLISPVLLLLAFGSFLTLWQCSARNIGWAAIAIAALIPCSLFAIEAVPQVRERHTRLGNDMAFLHDFIQERHHKSPPCVYCSLGRADLLWIDVRATSYFDIIQTAGVMFNRRTAEEIDRRAVLVAKFEMHRQREEAAFLDDARKVGMENLFKVPFDCAAPTEADLIRLCQEPGLDYIAIPHEFPGLYSASNGRIFVYECYKFSRSRVSANAKPQAAKPETSP